jgi:hypothetical protein
MANVPADLTEKGRNSPGSDGQVAEELDVGRAKSCTGRRPAGGTGNRIIQGK